MTIDDENVVCRQIRAGLLGGDVLAGFTLRGVILDEISQVVSRHEVVHCHDFDLFAQEALITDCAKHETTDAPETIDADFNHCVCGIEGDYLKQQKVRQGRDA
jgi:hypothetical protein